MRSLRNVILIFIFLPLILFGQILFLQGGDVKSDQISLTVVYDNNPHDKNLQTDWGFSCLIEGLQKTILFDTGGNGKILLSNMEKLDIDPKKIDIVFVSHNHSDHTGGLKNLLSANSNIEVVNLDDSKEIVKGALSTGKTGLIVREQSLIVDSKKGPIIITGCAHPGIVNIIKRAEALIKKDPFLVLGGFHLKDMSRSKIAKIIESFKFLGVKKVAPCHCTGKAATEAFKEAFGDNFIPIGVGSRMNI